MIGLMASLISKQEDFKARSEPMIHFQNALLALAKMDPLDLESSLYRITELDAETMGVERVSIWFFNDDRSEIVCQDLFHLGRGNHEKGARLKSVDFPVYFRALGENRILAADDAARHPSTREFTQSYLVPHGITSMMDVPIWRRGKMVGIVCHEHTGPLRNWTLEERDFSVSIADLVSLTLESSERKKAEDALREKAEELKRSNRELEQFAYIASHDLQEPVRKVIAFVDRLKSLESNREEQEKYLNRIQSAAFQMRQLIDDLLDYSRISTRAKPFDSINLDHIINESLYQLELRVAECGAEITVSPLPRIKADRVQMMKLFQNLLSNALKFRRPEISPRIRVEGEILKDGRLEIQVIDNGIGFDTKHLEKIFQPFQRLHSRGEYEGSGIGLAVCQKIVDRHQGELTAESRPGQGSVFIVRLPLEGKPKEGAS